MTMELYGIRHVSYYKVKTCGRGAIIILCEKFLMHLLIKISVTTYNYILF